jgi:hypothetical protein
MNIRDTPEQYLELHSGITCSDLDDAIFHAKDEADMNFFSITLELLLSGQMARNIELNMSHFHER